MVATGAIAWTQQVQELVDNSISKGSTAWVIANSAVNDAPAIGFSTLLATLLAATRSGFGIITGILVPFAVLCWSYYLGPRGDVRWHLPFAIAIAPAYLAMYLAWRWGAQVDTQSRSRLVFCSIVYSLVAVLAATSELWWRAYWAPYL